MDYTYLDYFNYYLKEFLNEIITKFPEFKQNVLSNYRAFLEGKEPKNDMYVKYFYTKINNYLIPIAKKDVSLFNNTGIVFLEGVDFNLLWNHRMNNDENRVAIWKYLQLLMLLGRKIVPDHKEIVDMLKKVGDQVNIPSKVQKTLAEMDEDERKEAEKGSGGLDLGNLMSMATGLAGAGGAGSGGLDLGGLVKNLTESLGNIDLPKPEDFASMNADGEGADGTPEGGATGEGASGADEGASANAASGANGSGMNLFSELAKEMSETFDFEELEKGGDQPKNVGEALQKFMSGNNPAKLMNMVNKFGNKLQTDIASGKVNQQDLLKETLGMMSNIQNNAGNPDALRKEAEKLVANNPELKASLGNMRNPHAGGSSGATADRLRAKLEQRKQQENSEK